MVWETTANTQWRCGHLLKVIENGLGIAVFNHVEHHIIIVFSSNMIVQDVWTLYFLYIISSDLFIAVDHFRSFQSRIKANATHVQWSAVITWSILSRSIRHRDDSDKTCIKLQPHRHPTPRPALTCEIWGVCYENLGENWHHHPPTTTATPPPPPTPITPTSTTPTPIPHHPHPSNTPPPSPPPTTTTTTPHHHPTTDHPPTHTHHPRVTTAPHCN